MTDERDDGSPGTPPAWIDHPRHVDWLFRGLVAAWALSILVSLLPYEQHPHFSFEALSFFQALFGLGGGLGLVLAARWVGRFLLRDEGYHDEPR